MRWLWMDSSNSSSRRNPRRPYRARSSSQSSPSCMTAQATDWTTVGAPPLVGHLLCMLPFLNCGALRLLDRLASAGPGSAQGIATFATSCAACCTLATPLERGRVPIPSFGNLLEPSNNLIGGLGMVSVQSSSFENTLYRFRHIEP